MDSEWLNISVGRRPMHPFNAIHPPRAPTVDQDQAVPTAVSRSDLRRCEGLRYWEASKMSGIEHISINS